MARVAVLMCTYNGERFLERQLESMRAQSVSTWELHASDDGSSDTTRTILERFGSQFGDGRIHVYGGPQKGFSKNFFSLIERVAIDADFFAFADQDDEWDTGKLARAITALEAVDASVPALYGTGSELITENGDSLGRSKIFARRPGFANALVQNMTTGNTMVLNRAAIDLLRRAGTEIDVSFHDWWTYLLVTGSGGVMIYDPFPTIRYRQHGSNLYGENRSLRAKWKRVSLLFKGDFRTWNQQHVAALRSRADMLTEKSLKRLELFEKARGAAVPWRLAYVWRSGVYRQTWDQQLGLFVAALLGRM